VQCSLNTEKCFPDVTFTYTLCAVQYISITFYSYTYGYSYIIFFLHFLTGLMTAALRCWNV